MATLIAHSPEPATRAFAQHLAETLGSQRGVTTAVEEFSVASRYMDSVDAVVVVAPASDTKFHRGARNFMAANYAETASRSLFVAALGTAEQLTDDQLQAIAAFWPRDTGYFRTDALDEGAVKIWAGEINSRGAV